MKSTVPVYYFTRLRRLWSIGFYAFYVDKSSPQNECAEKGPYIHSHLCFASNSLECGDETILHLASRNNAQINVSI